MTASPPVQRIRDPWLAEQGVQLSVLRLDQVHPTISGNKWYKLKYNLQRAKEEQRDTLLTVGERTPIICTPRPRPEVPAGLER